ncbi:MAG: DUF2807 domain-containing protein [Bacteroidales bacterium]|nr:DUF2807 domain-containing protein [Bacteroidales bacterium]
MKNMLFAAITAAALLSIQTGNAQSYSKSFDCTGFDKVSVEVVESNFLKKVEGEDILSKATVNLIQSDTYGVDVSMNDEYYSGICNASVDKKGTLSIKVDFSKKIPEKDTQICLNVSMPALTQLSASGQAVVNADGEFETSGDLKISLSGKAQVNGLKAKAQNAVIKMDAVSYANDLDITAASKISLKSSTGRIERPSFKADAIDLTVSQAGVLSDAVLRAGTLDLSVSNASSLLASAASFRTGNISVEYASTAELKSFSEEDIADKLTLSVKVSSRSLLSGLRCREVTAKMGQTAQAEVCATESLTYKNVWTSTVTNSVTVASVTDKSPAKVRARSDY